MNETTDMNRTQAMDEKAHGTMLRDDKGAVTPAPQLEAPLQAVADAVSAWPAVSATSHWHFYDRSKVDGVDFYVGDQELGHIHLDGALHLATSQTLGRDLIAQRLARPFPYQRGWVCEDVYDIGPKAAIALFLRNYEHLHPAAMRRT